MTDPSIPKEFFTPESIFTLTGAASAVYVVCGALQHALGFNPRWLALLLSLAISLIGTHIAQSAAWTDYLLAVLNGFLIYCTAVGVNTVLATRDGQGGSQLKTRSPSPDSRSRVSPRRFRTSWW